MPPADHLPDPTDRVADPAASVPGSAGRVPGSDSAARVPDPAGRVPDPTAPTTPVPERIPDSAGRVADPADRIPDLAALTGRLREFAAARDWAPFHTPKNLAMALAGEVGELISHFQWLSPRQSAAAMADPALAPLVEDELADVFLYLVQLADALGVDLLTAATAKINRNESRFPPTRG